MCIPNYWMATSRREGMTGHLTDSYCASANSTCLTRLSVTVFWGMNQCCPGELIMPLSPTIYW